MERGLTGEYIIKITGDETVKAFRPFPLPPDPPLEITADLRDALDQALLMCMSGKRPCCLRRSRGHSLLSIISSFSKSMNIREFPLMR